MSAIKVHEAMLPEFDYLSPQQIQRSVEHTYVEKIVATKVEAGNPIEFTLPKVHNYTALHDTKLELRIKITKSDGANTGDVATDKVGVANNILHTMFDKLELFINGHSKENQSNYAQRAYIDALTSYRHDSLTVRGALQGWNKDTATKMAIVDPAGVNTGFKDRSVGYASSGVVSLMGRVHSDIMMQGLCMPPDTDMKLTLVPSTSKFALIGPTSSEYKLVILEAILWVTRVAVCPSLQLALQKVFTHRLMTIPMRQVKVKTHTITSGVSETTLSNIFDNELPDRFLVGFLGNDSWGAGAKIDANPFNFAHHSVNFLQATRGDQLIPTTAYTPDFSSTKYIREYMALLEEFNADEGDATIPITKEDFAGGYALFPFRVVARSRGGDAVGPPASGGISLTLKFATPTASVLNVVLYYESRTALELTPPKTE